MESLTSEILEFTDEKEFGIQEDYDLEHIKEFENPVEGDSYIYQGNYYIRGEAQFSLPSYNNMLASVIGGDSRMARLQESLTKREMPDQERFNNRLLKVALELKLSKELVQDIIKELLPKISMRLKFRNPDLTLISQLIVKFNNKLSKFEIDNIELKNVVNKELVKYNEFIKSELGLKRKTLVTVLDLLRYTRWILKMLNEEKEILEKEILEKEIKEKEIKEKEIFEKKEQPIELTTVPSQQEPSIELLPSIVTTVPYVEASSIEDIIERTKVKRKKK